MIYKIRMTPQTRNDLRGIFAYIAFALQSPQNAAGQLDRLAKSIDSLEQMPERFRLYDREPWRSCNLRVMPVDHYLVFYLPNREGETVTVVRVMYGGRDIDRQLESMVTKDR